MEVEEQGDEDEEEGRRSEDEASLLFLLMLLQCGTIFLLSCALYNPCLFLRRVSSTIGILNNY